MADDPHVWNNRFDRWNDEEKIEKEDKEFRIHIQNIISQVDYKTAVVG